jgi:hypothetical protein
VARTATGVEADVETAPIVDRRGDGRLGVDVARGKIRSESGSASERSETNSDQQGLFHFLQPILFQATSLEPAAESLTVGGL